MLKFDFYLLKTFANKLGGCLILGIFSNLIFDSLLLASA